MDQLQEARDLGTELKKEHKQKTKINYFQTFKQLVKYLSADKLKLSLALTFSFLNSACYVIGSFIIGTIAQLYFQTPIETGVPLNDAQHNQFIWMLVGLALSFIAYGFIRYYEQKLYISIAFNAGARLRTELMTKLYKLPVSFYDKNKSGNLLSTLIVDINNISNSSFQMLTQTWTSFFNILISIIVMSIVSGLLTIIVLPISILLFGFVFLFMKKSQPYFVRVQDAFGRLNAFVEEMVANTKVTNAFNQREKVYKELEEITLNIRNSAYKGDSIAKLFDTWYGLISNTVILLITVLAAQFALNGTNIWTSVPFFQTGSGGRANSAVIILYVSLNWNFMGPFQNILSSLFNAQVGIASTSRVFKLISIQEPSRDHETIIIDNIKGEVEFKDVYFKYNPEALEYQLKAASFKVKAGQTVAIVGPTGAGKTTIINLLSKYYDYERGSITIDGNEIRNINTKSLRDNMTIVLQDSFLFNETILENLKMSNKNATFEEVEKAAKMTNVHHFIMSLPNGYDTVVENNGSNISQGQRQLLSLTRAILSNKSLLILDEATSNIDSSTEQIVQASMLELMKNKTSFVIAHRLSTIKNADLIIVVNNGLILEQGTHKSLLEKQGFYYNLYTSQFDL
ncbi:ABC transporter ATP-binding protein [Mycoplasma sp. Pen4]|uniref:ABC transporter ATP-binding protein n=1 Tax=Mycoplasma sp. Pen4 TaxID=640330 RepID=UPI0016548581|nr:ABC transporter ATP-binding protein [Mycoplasma sp. Pen4]QNM93542.1 ABC transporter ATP-binding protein [Mycoplasma sp. Pen4]